MSGFDLAQVVRLLLLELYLLLDPVDGVVNHMLRVVKYAVHGFHCTVHSPLMSESCLSVRKYGKFQ